MITGERHLLHIYFFKERYRPLFFSPEAKRREESEAYFTDTDSRTFTQCLRGFRRALWLAGAASVLRGAIGPFSAAAKSESGLWLVPPRMVFRHKVTELLEACRIGRVDSLPESEPKFELLVWPLKSVEGFEHCLDLLWLKRLFVFHFTDWKYLMKVCFDYLNKLFNDI